jgi:MSHA biogenesis protein MshI
VLRKQAAQNIWTAVAIGHQQASVAQVERRGPNLPLVHFCASFRKADNDLSTLRGLRLAIPKRSSAGTTLLGRGQYEVHLVPSPNVPANERAQAVRWQLQDRIDYSAEEASVDVIEVPSDPARATEVKQLFAVSARSATIRQRIAAFHGAKLPLSAIDIPELAQRNIAQLYEIDAHAVGLLSLGEEGSLLTFSHGGELLVARQIDITLSQLQDATGSNFEPVMERIGLEIQRTYDHIDRQFNYAGVSRVLVTPLAKEFGAIEYLAANLSVRVQPINLHEVLDLSAVPEASDPMWQTTHLHTIGAALRAENPVS